MREPVIVRVLRGAAVGVIALWPVATTTLRAVHAPRAVSTWNPVEAERTSRTVVCSSTGG